MEGLHRLDWAGSGSWVCLSQTRPQGLHQWPWREVAPCISVRCGIGRRHGGWEWCDCSHERSRRLQAEYDTAVVCPRPCDAVHAWLVRRSPYSGDRFAGTMGAGHLSGKNKDNSPNAATYALGNV